MNQGHEELAGGFGFIRCVIRVDYLIEERAGIIMAINAFTVCHDLTQCQHGILVVCQQCGSVTELHQPKLRQALVAQIEDAGYRLASDEIELKGLCAACQAAEKAAEKTATTSAPTTTTTAATTTALSIQL